MPIGKIPKPQQLQTSSNKKKPLGAPKQGKKGPVQNVKKSEEIPKKVYDDRSASRIASLEFTKLLEEQERLRRIAQLDIEKKEEEFQTKANLVYAKLMEEEERERRIIEYPEKRKHSSLLLQDIRKLSSFLSSNKGSIKGFKDYITENNNVKNQRELDLAYTHVVEEQERQRRIAMDAYTKELENDRRLTNKAYTIISEEKERDRRIAEENFLKEQERERRKTNHAYTIVAEEQERMRRIVDDEYMKEQEIGYRANNRAWATIATEEERARLLSFGQFTGIPKEKIENNKKVFKEAAQKAIQKGITGETQHVNHHHAAKRVWLRKHTNVEKVEQKAEVPIQDTKQVPVTQPPSQQIPATEPKTDRKSMVDQMTEQLFIQLQSKIGLTSGVMGK